MQRNEMAGGTRRHTGGTGRGLKALLIGGLLAATLTMGAGLAVVGTAATGAVVGGLGVAYGACQHMEADLAADLGVSAPALRASDAAGVPARLAARGGSLTATQAQRAAGLAEAYADCRAVFGDINAEWDER